MEKWTIQNFRIVVEMNGIVKEIWIIKKVRYRESAHWKDKSRDNTQEKHFID